jgi:hypothetical protein
MVANLEEGSEALAQTQHSGSERRSREHSAYFHLTLSLVQPRSLSCDPRDGKGLYGEKKTDELCGQEKQTVEKAPLTSASAQPSWWN